MPRPSKIKDKKLLKRMYVDMKMSTTEISKVSRDKFGVYVSAVSIMNNLKTIGVKLRSKSESISIACAKKTNKDSKKLVMLNEVVKNSIERWNTRWLVTSGKIKCLPRSMFEKEEADKLRRMLDEAGDKCLVPDKLVEEEWEYWSKMGFPYVSLSLKDRTKEWKELAKFTPQDQGPFPWAGRNTGLANFFHKHMFDCRKKGKMTPKEFFNSKKDFQRGIKKLLCLYPRISASRIREICRNESASSRINNFPPRVAKTILERSCEGKAVSVLDPCAGFSGRMLGCASSKFCSRYVGIDISRKTYKGLVATSTFLRKVSPDTEVHVTHGDCNVVMPSMSGEKFDMVLTSPPFLDAEQYDGVPFETNYDGWLSNFVTPLIRNSRQRLRRGGMMIMYVEKIKGHDFARDLDVIASKRGFAKNDGLNFHVSYGENIRDKTPKRTIGVLRWIRK